MNTESVKDTNPAIKQYYAAHLKRVAKAAQQEGGLDRGMILSLVFYALDEREFEVNAEQDQVPS